MSDARLALRFLLKKPGWTVAAVLTVAIGIAGSTLAFSLVDRALRRPLGFAAGGELVTLYARSGGEYSTIPWRDYTALRDVLRDGGDGLADLAAFVRTFSTVGGGEYPELHEGELVSGNFFSVLRARPFLGRLITASDNVKPGAHPVIVLSHMLWRRQFASDPDVRGREVRLDGRLYEVIGVAQPGFRGPVWPSFESAFWIPAMMAAEEFESDQHAVFEGAGLPVFQTVGRVRGGQPIEALQARIDPLDAVLARERVDSPYFPDTGRDWRVAVLPGNYLRLWPEYRAPVARVLLVLGLLAMAGLLVGCANLATLLIARGLERRRELAVRRALGAGALDLAWRVGAEVALLVAAGGTVAAGLVYTLSPLVPLLPLGVPYELDLSPDRRVLGFGVAAAALAAVLFAALPLAQVFRDRTVLTVGERMATTGSGGVRAMNGLVVVQVALSLVLLASCGLLVRSALRAAGVDLGFHAGQGLTARVTVPGLSTEERAALFRALVDRLRSEPFVEAASASGGGTVVSFLPAGEVYVHDSPVAGPASAVTARYRPVSRGYFETLGIPLLAGRDFEAAEEQGAAVAIVNRSLAERYWPGTNPMGRSLQRAAEDEPRRIVGVVGDAGRRSVRSPAYAMVYVPHAQDAPSWTWVNLRTRADPRRGLSVLREHLRALDAGGAVSAPRTFAELRADAAADARLQAGLASGLAAVAVVLALIGLYGLMGYVVGCREREIGIRGALGATPASIVRLMLLHAERLTGIGLLLGLAASVVATGGLADLLYETEPRDPLTLAGAAVVLGLAAMIAAFAPARRAARVDPASVLRAD